MNNSNLAVKLQPAARPTPLHAVSPFFGALIGAHLSAFKRCMSLKRHFPNQTPHSAASIFHYEIIGDMRVEMAGAVRDKRIQSTGARSNERYLLRIPSANLGIVFNKLDSNLYPKPNRHSRKSRRAMDTGLLWDDAFPAESLEKSKGTLLIVGWVGDDFLDAEPAIHIVRCGAPGDERFRKVLYDPKDGVDLRVTATSTATPPKRVRLKKEPGAR